MEQVDVGWARSAENVCCQGIGLHGGLLLWGGEGWVEEGKVGKSGR